MREEGSGPIRPRRVTLCGPAWDARGEPRVQGAGRGVGEGGDLVDDHALAGPVVRRRVEQGTELRVQAVRGAGGERLGQLGDDDPLVGAEPLLLGALHDVPVGDRLEDGALVACLARDDQLGRVPGEPAGAVRRAGGALRRQAEAADELAGRVLEPGLRDGRCRRSRAATTPGRGAGRGPRRAPRGRCPRVRTGRWRPRRSSCRSGSACRQLGSRWPACRPSSTSCTEYATSSDQSMTCASKHVRSLGGALADPVEDRPVVLVDAELRARPGRWGGRRAARGTWWRRRGRRG